MLNPCQFYSRPKRRGERKPRKHKIPPGRASCSKVSSSGSLVPLAGVASSALWTHHPSHSPGGKTEGRSSPLPAPGQQEPQSLCLRGPILSPAPPDTRRPALPRRAGHIPGEPTPCSPLGAGAARAPAFPAAASPFPATEEKAGTWASRPEASESAQTGSGWRGRAVWAGNPLGRWEPPHTPSPLAGTALYRRSLVRF